MEAELRTVIDLLFEQKRILETCLELSREKKQVIIKCDTERLNQIVQNEARLVRGLNAAEKKRVSVTAAIARMLEMPAEDVTVRVLAERAQGRDRERLHVIQRELPSLLKEQKELNELNQTLLETQLDYTDAMLSAVVGEEDPLNHFYGGDGKAETEMRRSAGLFDRQI